MINHEKTMSTHLFEPLEGGNLSRDCLMCGRDIWEESDPHCDFYLLKFYMKQLNREGQRNEFLVYLQHLVLCQFDKGAPTSFLHGNYTIEELADVVRQMEAELIAAKKEKEANAVSIDNARMLVMKKAAAGQAELSSVKSAAVRPLTPPEGTQAEGLNEL